MSVERLLLLALCALQCNNTDEAVRLLIEAVQKLNEERKES